MNQLFRRKPIEQIMNEGGDHIHTDAGMKRTLTVRDLTALGIAAVVGAGIFSTVGTAAANGGPAVALLFVFTAVACGFSALCYAQFASRIPVSGSAYTYAYASFGELVAWIIGWDLLMEYGIGNVAVAISWSDYFTTLINGIGLHIPAWCTVDYLSAHRGFEAAKSILASGGSIEQLSHLQAEAYEAWNNAPTIFGLRVIADLPSFGIVVFITWLVYRGIQETKVAGNIMVLIKLAVLLLVIAVGAFYVSPENWSPFAPNGLVGVMKGVSGVFFAYIGFDAISTTAEECRNPERDLPRSMIYALVITTILYVVLCLVLTGMMHYSELGVGDPLAHVFQHHNLQFLSGIIALSAVIAMASVLLVFQMGQPRIWMSMSRDGLLPKRFASLHKRYRTPAFSTIITGLLVAIPGLFVNLTEVTDLTSIGTLFAFALVSGGILLLDKNPKEKYTGKGFKVPYYNSRYWLPILAVATLWAVLWLNYDGVVGFFDNQGGWEEFKHKIPMYIFMVFVIILFVVSVLKELSLIPVLGLLTNLYLMTELGITNWVRFIIWLGIGLLIYFLYGYQHSKLRKQAK